MKPIDVRAGNMTYGQRIELGQILAGDKTDFEKFNAVFVCLHGKKPHTWQYKKRLAYFEQIVEGLIFWMEQEKNGLKYEPSPEELRAGIKKLSEEIGEFGTIKAIAKAYNTDPDNVLLWKYSKVFGILFTDLKEYLYSKRFNQVLEDKYKK